MDLNFDDTEEWRMVDGKLTTIQPIKNIAEQLVSRFKIIQDTNNRLAEENQKLKEGIWEKEEVAKYKSEYDRMQQEYYHNGFPITNEQKDAINKWYDEHRGNINKKLKNSGHWLTYAFHPTHLGTSGEVICSCGQKFEFQELG